MSKELEALEPLDALDELKSHTDWTWKDADNYEIIKSALEQKEKLEKVWEIVRNKPLSELHKSLIASCFNYVQYKEEWKISFKKFCREIKPQCYTKEEFDLLKEMLK